MRRRRRGARGRPRRKASDLPSGERRAVVARAATSASSRCWSRSRSERRWRRRRVGRRRSGGGCRGVQTASIRGRRHGEARRRRRRPSPTRRRDRRARRTRPSCRRARARDPELVVSAHVLDAGAGRRAAARDLHRAACGPLRCRTSRSRSRARSDRLAVGGDRRPQHASIGERRQPGSRRAGRATRPSCHSSPCRRDPTRRTATRHPPLHIGHSAFAPPIGERAS